MSKYQTKVDYNELTMHHPEAGDVRRAEGSIEIPRQLPSPEGEGLLGPKPSTL